MLVVRAGGGGAPARLVCANVGDSRAVLCRRGAAVALSSDHRATRPDERARIVAAGGSVVGDRLNGVLAVSRAFGDAEHKARCGGAMWGQSWTADPCSAEPEVVDVELARGADEFALVASDGVWDALSSAAAVAFVRRRLLAHRDAARAARELVAKALELGSKDNVSAVVVDFAEVDDGVDEAREAEAP